MKPQINYQQPASLVPTPLDHNMSVQLVTLAMHVHLQLMDQLLLHVHLVSLIDICDPLYQKAKAVGSENQNGDFYIQDFDVLLIKRLSTTKI